MGELKDRLKSDLTDSMKARDELRTATLRMALTAIGNEEVAGKVARVLTGEQELTVLAREAKKRREAAEAFRTGGAQERADREVAEEAVLQTYLPTPLSDEELQGLVAQALAEVAGGSPPPSQPALGPQDMGRIMKAVGPKVSGRADGGRVAAAVRTALQG